MNVQAVQVSRYIYNIPWKQKASYWCDSVKNPVHEIVVEVIIPYNKTKVITTRITICSTTHSNNLLTKLLSKLVGKRTTSKWMSKNVNLYYSDTFFFFIEFPFFESLINFIPIIFVEPMLRNFRMTDCFYCNFLYVLIILFYFSSMYLIL